VLAPDRSDAILMLHGTTASGAQFLPPTTADFLFDQSGTSGWDAIVPNAPRKSRTGTHTSEHSTG
jgi:hypothetical protein